jgi:hypothetical protein
MGSHLVFFICTLPFDTPSRSFTFLPVHTFSEFYKSCTRLIRSFLPGSTVMGPMFILLSMGAWRRR